MAIIKDTMEYTDGDTVLEATLAWDDAIAGPRPAVMVAHAWAGKTHFEIGKAEELASQGYLGCALDVYGKGVTGNSPEENSALMQPLLDDRGTLLRRLRLAMEKLANQDLAAAGEMAAIGFCFGGLSVLDLARSGANLKGVVSLHGLFSPPGREPRPIIAKVLVLHGWDDPMAPPDQVLALTRELTDGAADWQLHAYGNTMHAFTNPEANMPDDGILYVPRAERRALQAMKNFLGEVFS